MAKQKVVFSEEQRNDFSISMIETIKSFFQKVFHSEQPLHGKELNDYLLNQAESEEERETLQEMFEENETYHAKLKELEKSGKDIDEWYDEEITKTVKQMCPEVTIDDIDKVKEAVAKQIDDETEGSISGLEYLDGLIVDTDKKEATE